jgi:hypothetical protein
MKIDKAKSTTVVDFDLRAYVNHLPAKAGSFLLG